MIIFTPSSELTSDTLKKNFTVHNSVKPHFLSRVFVCASLTHYARFRHVFLIAQKLEAGHKDGSSGEKL